ncbi:MAG: metallophosphatase domain-containing protein [Vulcanimicrobiaceae bacterium]|jgi:Icc-related predicted phosphoesterase
MRIVAISDTHLRMDAADVPDGDLLLHAGDLTMRGELEEITRAGSWLRALPHRHKVVIAGNHDFAFEDAPHDARAALGEGLTYLEDDGVTIEGLRFWGSPWQPRFFDWAFNLDRGAALAAKWNMIPTATDVLVTHGPPAGILDLAVSGEHVGCADLLRRVQALRPRVHVFGHIHEAAGVLEQHGTTFVNASICDVDYRPTAPARVIDL